MNILVDRHHAGLFHSIQLMARRFGWTVYTPSGMGWWDEEYWSFGRWTWPDDRLAKQYLMAPHEPDNEFPDWPIAFVTLAEARQMDWAYVMATVQDDQQGFARFAREMGAQYVYQVGNTGQQVDWSLDPLALLSSEMPILGRGIRYHQEMDPIAFQPVNGETHVRQAATFVNCMSSMGECWDLLTRAVETVPVAVYGIDGPMGVVKPNTALVGIMARHGWGWHDKAHGDGFGHVIHSWAAVGRPLVGHAAHYAGKMGERFWDDDMCIDLGLFGIEEAVDIIQTMPLSTHAEMCHAIRAEFDLIDWDGEAEMVADFLGVRVPA